MRDTRYGLFIAPKLSDLPPGLHGFHVHENPACGPTAPNSQAGAGLAAGGHYDPAKTGKHLGPEDPNGHLGDLPVLVAAAIHEQPMLRVVAITGADEPGDGERAHALGVPLLRKPFTLAELRAALKETPTSQRRPR